MSELIAIKHDLKRFKGSLKKMDKATRQAVLHSVNRASQQAKTATGRKVRELYIIKQKDVMEKITLRRATSQHLQATLKARGYVIPLIKFGAPKQKPKRVPKVLKVGVFRKEKRHPYPGAFVEEVGKKYRRLGVFVRKGKKRYPIREVYGPSVPSMLAHQEVKEHAETVYGETMLKRLPHELNRALGRLNL